MSKIDGRCFGLALALATALPLAPRPARAAESEAPAEQETRVMASVKVEIRQSDGKVVKSSPQIIEWDEDGTVRIEADDHVHAVELKVHRKDDDGRKLGIHVAYAFDGSPVIAPYDYETRAKKREVLRTDGGIALAITVAPKRVVVEAPPKESGHGTIEIPDGDNPLDGI